MSGRPLRLIFMGTPEFALPSLSAVIAGPDDLLAVISQPDRPQGRGRRIQPTPTRQLADRHGIPVLQPTKIKTEEFRQTIAAMRPDAIVVAAYGRILPGRLLELPRHGCINVHGSLLPRHRGAAPIQWSIIRGDAEVGVTIMQMDEGMDTGDILVKAAFTPDPDETAGSLFPKIARLGSEKLMDTLDMLAQGGIAGQPQDESEATAAPMLKKEDGLVDWGKAARDIDCLIRGLDPWPTAFSYLDSRKLQLFRPEVVHLDSGREPGTVLRADREGLLLATGRHCLLVREVKPEGKRRMPVGDFLNGQRVEPGNHLTGAPTAT